MPAGTTFGRRAAAQTLQSPRSVAAAAVAAEPGSSTRNGALDPFYLAGIPVITCGLIAALVLIFIAEIRLSGDISGTLSPSRQDLIALGGIDGKLTLGAHQWWRVLTAPLLHGGLTHLLGNCVALFLAGLFLEPLIGAGWFGVLFFGSALGGAAGSLAQNDAGMVSVGASGAITGLLMATLLSSAREKDPARRRQMQFWSVRILIPAVAPLFFTSSNTGGTDYGAHAGGAMTGAIIWLVLSGFWQERQKTPPGQKRASVIAAIAALAAVGAFSFAGLSAQNAAPPTLIPQSALSNGAEAIRHSADLLARYPADPRAHYFRALYLYDRNELGGAADELRAGMAALPAHSDEFRPVLGQSMIMTLALIQKQEGDLDAARNTARTACAAAPPDLELLQTLRREKICD